MNLEESYIMIDEYDGWHIQRFFFDTYAFFEILNGNEHYKKYNNFSLVTSKLNLFELYFNILRNVNSVEAERVFDKYYPFVIDFDEEVIKEAARLKMLLNKRDVSMTDCIGYCLAKQLGVRFLTGDDAFENLDNVEFVI